MKRLGSIIVIMILVGSGFRVISSPDSFLENKKTTIDFSVDLVDENNFFVRINLMNSNSFLIKTNKPLLPSYTKTFILPVDAKITRVSCSPCSIQNVLLDKKIICSPAPTSLDLNISVEKKNIVQVKNLYDNIEGFYPGKWFSYQVGRGIKGDERCIIVKIQLLPVQYNPSENLVQISQKMNIDVEYKKTQKPVSKSRESYSFVIISPTEFQEELMSLVEHKNTNRMSTKLVMLDEIYNGKYFPCEGRDPAEQIKYFIKNTYDEWGTSYVLLVGDEEKIPVRETHVHVAGDDKYGDEVFVTDLYYADLYDSNGSFLTWDSNKNDVFGEYNWSESGSTDKVDLYPDVYLGRLACIDENQVVTTVDKIINYELNEAYSQKWFRNLILCGGDSFPGDQNETLEGEFVNEAVINIMDGFQPDRIWASNRRLGRMSPTGAQEISNSINEGAGFIDFSGHGNKVLWATHPHRDNNTWLPTPVGGYQSYLHVSKLENGYKLPIVIVGACSVSKFNSADSCFGWSFLANPQGGGIACFGSTGIGYAYLGEWVTQGLVEKMVLNTFESYKEDVKTLGEMWASAVNKYVNPDMEDYDYKTVEEWEPLGDPSLAVSKESQPPYKPGMPNGPTAGEINVDYEYNCFTSDPDSGDLILYLFNWDDGSNSGWLGPYESGESVSCSHNWTNPGVYDVKVKAKDFYNAESNWSDPLTVTITGSGDTPFFPSNPHPSDLKENVPLNTILRCNVSDPNDDDMDVTFSWGLNDEKTGEKTVYNTSSGSRVETNIEKLKPDSLYWWYVTVSDGEHLTKSKTWHFSTIKDTTPPSVNIISPEQGVYINNKKILPFLTTIIIGETEIKINASDQESWVKRVEIFINNEKAKSLFNEPYIWTWDKKGFGKYVIKAVAYDAAGNQNFNEKTIWKIS